MPSTIIDSAIFQGIFSSDEMRQVWSDENRTQKYLDIEAALARVQGRLGLIPQEAADEIVSHCQLEQIDMAKLRQQTERIGYPILGVVSQLNALCRDKLGEYCHWGATTQDITDTATVLQIREGTGDRRARARRDLGRDGAACEDASRYADDRAQQPAAGDSGDLRLQDGGPAVGDRAPSRAPRPAEGARAGRRVRRRRPARSRRCKVARWKPQAALCAELGLKQPVIAWHTIRDNIAEVGAFLGLVGGHARQSCRWTSS
jgi:3-carboxy-cis,cis-muconate cycloisomerase